LSRFRAYKLRILLSFLSIVYIAAIFLLAGSPIVQSLSRFNPVSLLHIPLYGILTLLLIFSIVPTTLMRKDAMTPQGNDPINLSREMRSLFHWDPSHPITRFWAAGFIAFAVGIADEIYQFFVPSRNASIMDVLLDLVGIGIAIVLALKLLKKRYLSHIPPQVQTKVIDKD
jgi:VanZ family protein